MADTARAHFKEADKHIRSNIYRGGTFNSRRTKLNLPLDLLKRHMDATEDRRLAHRQLAVLVPVMRKLRAGLQRNESFEPGQSATLRTIGLTFATLSLRSSRSQVTPETYVASYLLSRHSRLFTREASPESAIASSPVPLSPPERRLAHKSALFNKIVASVPLDEKETQLLQHLFYRKNS
jgi:hypothetical protein